jgi:hypothetical protein
LTKKFNGEYYHKEAKTIMFNNEIDYNTIQKLGKLEDLEEELGCPLEVVLKALKNGIVDIENHEHRHIHLRDNGTSNYPKGWMFHTFHFTYEFSLSDYKKTWWLKGEKENAD